jgi:WD40 repeat protein
MSKGLWQHPFVDVFKLVNLPEWRVARREGEVSELLDKTIAKRVYRVWGSVSAANYIQIPRGKGTIRSLGLTGRYVYLQVMAVHNKLFSVHLDFSLHNVKTNSEEVLRLSVSNLFKSHKLVNALQLSLNLTDRWTVVVLDIPALVRTYAGSHLHSHSLRSLTLCSNLFVRGVYTSDVLYSPNTLPRELSFKCTREQNWLSLYDWVELPSQSTALASETYEVSEEDEEESVEKENRLEEEKVRTATPRSRLSEPAKSPRTNLRPQVKSPRQDYERREAIELSQPRTAPSQPVKEREFKETIEPSRPKTASKSPPQRKAPTKELPRAEIVCPESPIKAPVPREVMSPDPILRLEHVIGYNGGRKNNVKWTRDDSVFVTYPAEFREGSRKYLVFAAGNTIVLMNPVTRAQQFLFGHTSVVKCLVLSTDGRLLVTAQEGPAPLVLIWELATRKTPTFIGLSKLTELKSLDISASAKFIVTSGVDERAREIINIWDISNCTTGAKPFLAAKQVSSFHLNEIRYSPVDDDRLVSCGKENIRFWRVSKKHLSGAAVVLNHHARNSEFTSLDFECSLSSAISPKSDELLKRIFVGAAHGLIFQVNYHTRELEGVFQIHDGPVKSLSVTEGFCVTVSGDGYLRIWPLDFTEFYLEAHHEGGVSAVDVSADRMSVVCGTDFSALGIVDMSSNAYRTLLRSHTQTILSTDVQESSGLILTVSSDQTIRVWNSADYAQLYEFTSPEDEPLVGSYHPTDDKFSVGFMSGTVRIFCASETTVIHEFIQHEAEVVQVVYSPDGTRMASISTDGLACIYDVRRNYSPVKTISVDLTHDFVYVCFSKDSSLFAVLGSASNSITVWASATLSMKYRVDVAGNPVKMEFSPNGQDLIVQTQGSDSRLKFYRLNGLECTLVKELGGLHPNAVMDAFSISQNNKYLVTGGSDRILKVWDYTMRTGQAGQAFIGHSQSIANLCFSRNSSHIFSSSKGLEGLFVWRFLGDTSSSLKTDVLVDERPVAKAPAKLEMRPQSKQYEPQAAQFRLEKEPELDESVIQRRPTVSEKQRLKLPSRHVLTKARDFDLQQVDLPHAGEAILSLERLLGYDTDVQDNLWWSLEKGWFAYSMEAGVVLMSMDIEVRQHFLQTGPVTCFALSDDSSLLAAASVSEVQVWDTDRQLKVKTLKFHEAPVQTLAFTPSASHLVTVGDYSERLLVVWELYSGSVVATTVLSAPVHTLRFNPAEAFEFVTGGAESLLVWRLSHSDQLEFQSVKVKAKNVTALCYSKVMSDLARSVLFIGTDSGHLQVMDSASYTSLLEIKTAIDEIDSIQVGGERVWVAGQCSNLMSWRVAPSWNDTRHELETARGTALILDGNTIATSGDPSGHEGLVGTDAGTVWYVNWMDLTTIRVLNSHLGEVKGIDPQAYLGTISADGSFRVWNQEAPTQVLQSFSGPATSLAFHPNKPRVVTGCEDGALRIYCTAALKSIGKVQLQSGSIGAVKFMGTELLCGTESGRVLRLSAGNWDSPNFTLKDYGMAGAEVVSIDIAEDLVLLSTSEGSASVWRVKDSWSLLNTFNVFENPHGDEEVSPAALGLYQSRDVQAVFYPAMPGVVLCIAPALQYVYFYNYQTNSLLRRLPLLHFPSCISSHPASPLFAVGTTDSCIRLFEADGEVWQDYVVHSDALSCLHWSTDKLWSSSGVDVLQWRLL